MIEIKGATVQNALIKPKGGAPQLKQMPRPVPREGELLIRVICTGLCRTDLLVASGAIAAAKDNIVLGHEFCGIVENVEGQNSPLVGHMVAVDPTFTRDDGSDGFMGREIDGCIATWAIVPAERVFPVLNWDGQPGDQPMSPREAAYLEPVAAAMGGVDTAVTVSDALRNNGHGVLVGHNRIATLTAMLLRDRNLKFDHISHDKLRDLVRCNLAANRWHWMIETGLTDDLCELAAEALKARGTLILKSRHRASASFPAIRWAEKQLNLAGRSRSGFPSAMRWLSENLADVRPLLGRSYRLSDWEAAFADANAGEHGKTFIVSPGAEHLFPDLMTLRAEG